MRFLVLLAVSCLSAFAQAPQPQLFVTSDPSTTPGAGRLGSAPRYNYVNGKVWNCKQTSGFSCTWTANTSGSGANIQVTGNLLKGDNAGNGLAATPGTDYVVPTGNVATASAFDHTPTPCPTNQYAIASSPNGNLSCAQVAYSQISGTPVVVVDPGVNGFVSRTGLGTSTARTIQGTASDITVTNGDGIAGNPVIDLPNTAVTPGACGDSTHFAVPTFDTKGRATGCTTNLIGGGGVTDPGANGVMFRSALNTTNAAKADQIDAASFCTPSGGSGTAYACSLSPAITAYVTGNHYRFKADVANTGTAPTINLNSLGAVTIVKAAGGVTSALAANDLRAGQWVDVVYDGTNMQIQSTLGNVPAGSPGGSTTQLQYNNSGVFSGITGATSNGTTLTLVAPILGTPASATLTNATGLPISTGVSGLAAGIATFLATPSSANLLATMTTKTGTGLAVFGTGPTLSSLTLSDVATGTQCLHANASGVISGIGVDCGPAVSVFTGSTASSSTGITGTATAPIFSLADQSVKSPTRFEPAALTANVTSVTLTNRSAGAKFSIAWLQDATGGHTITYGASASNTCTISATASKTTVQEFEIAADGTTVVGTGCTSDDPLDTPVTGPASSTTNDCPKFADTSGKVLSDAGVCLLSGGALGTPSSGNASNLTNLPITLTTTGTSGASTYTQSTNTLNIPQYSGGGSSAGTVVPKTANYTLLSTDSGSVFTFNGSSLTATLVATPPTMPWIVGIKNMNASDLTVARNGNTINGGTSNLTLHQYQEVSCESDTVTGTEYKCTTPISVTTPVTLTAAANGQTLACATCVVASSPGVGIAHFAGSTQTVTSSLIVAADITSGTITGTQIASSVALAGSPTTTTQSANDNSTKIATTAYVDTKPVSVVDFSTGTSKTFSLNSQYFECTSTCTITMPVPAAGKQYCVRNATGVTTVITFAAIGSSSMYEKTDFSAYGTAGTGTAVSGGSAADKLCLVGKDATHYDVYSFGGTWTVN